MFLPVVLCTYCVPKVNTRCEKYNNGKLEFDYTTFNQKKKKRME